MAIISIFGILFVHFAMNETKGQCLDDIGIRFPNKNKTQSFKEQI